ncbi:hypothetical protein AX774_g3913 [Zancudomyces culisetae]|uniref:Uncharacterized protein n=1 Tax=Zancudomyces culisetae TaxID=1213189 RepID=A0A1R1PNR9_ZANCU|nr:hypothetical protein AX774_g3913 [Zancudomyces culisetae]|eukprot:OMH82608.1 hypothetical protein AX774_g3913 [Zancudomyces culisetae]
MNRTTNAFKTDFILVLTFLIPSRKFISSFSQKDEKSKTKTKTKTEYHTVPSPSKKVTPKKGYIYHIIYLVIVPIPLSLCQ